MVVHSCGMHRGNKVEGIPNNKVILDINFKVSSLRSRTCLLIVVSFLDPKPTPVQTLFSIRSNRIMC